MGSKGGSGGQRTPSVAKISLESAQRLKIVDLICEGVKDLAHPISAKDVFLDGTPLQNEDGSYNFEGVEIYGLPGTPDQDYLPGFETSDTVIGVGAEVKQSQSVTRTITDPAVDRIRVTIGLGGLEEVTSQGDIVGRAVQLKVSASHGSQVKQKNVTIRGRTNGAYHRDVVLTDLPPVPFNLTVSRITHDSNDNRIRDKTHWVSYVESIDAKLNYPDSVVVGLKIDSKLFGGRVPRRTYRSHWTVIEVPTNYNPDTRQYDGVWDGKFKRAWSNNPAWIYRDLVLNDRYGLARFRDDVTVDKWALYAIAKYCDQMVDDGNGGQEPRFVCNAYLTQPRDAYDVLSDLASCFRGITFFDGMQQVAVNDTPRDPVAIYTNSNVVEGLFEYSGVGYKDITTACIVKFADEKNSYLTDSVQYQDDAAIARFGYNVKTMTGFGVTSRGQAQRVARWYVETSLRERESVQFSVGREGIKHLPYDIIRIADNDYAGTQLGARIVSTSGTRVTLDREIDTTAERMHYLDTNGKERYRSISSVDGATLTLSSAPTGINELGVVCISLAETAPRLFRAIGITENDNGTYTISAVTHDPQKEAVVDAGAHRHDEIAATRYGKPQVYSSRVERDGRDLSLKWDAIAADAVSYQIKLYRNGELYKTYNSDTTSIDVSNLPLGDYRAEIRARNKDGGFSDAVEQAWSINYDITAFRATPKVFAVEFDWSVPPNLVNDAWIELWYSATDDVTDATRLARLPYPASQFTMQNVNLHEQWYVWARIIDSNGNTGAWTDSVLAQPTTDPDPILKQIEGAVSSSELSQTLIAQLAANDSAAAANAMASEAAARAQAIAAEAQARADAINAQAAQQTAALNQKATQLGNQISAVESVNDSQAQQISTLTTASDNNTAAIETERQARIAADNAEAAERNTLATQVAGNQSSINQLSQTVSNNQSSTATQINNLSSTIDNISVGVRNLFIANKKLANKYVRAENGNLGNSRAGHHASAFIAVTANKKYTVLPKSGVLVYLRAAFYDADGVFISGSVSGDSDKKVVLTAPAGAKKLRISAEWAGAGEGFAVYAGKHTSAWTPAPEDIDGQIGVVSAELNSYKQTQASRDAAQTEEINSAKSRIGSAESSINQLSQTVSNNQSTTATQINNLSSKIAAQPHGANLVADGGLQNPLAWRSHYSYITLDTSYFRSDVSSSPTAPYAFKSQPGGGICWNYSKTDVVISSNRKYRFSAHFKNDGGDGGFRFTYYKQNGSYGYRGLSIPNDGEWHYREVVINGNAFGSSVINPGFSVNHSGTTGAGFIADFKFEDVTDIKKAEAELNSYKSTQASVDAAQTEEIDSAKSRIGNAEAAITQQQQTLATLDGKVSSTYTVKAEAISGGKKAMTGITLGATSDGTTAQAGVIVLADLFQVAKNAADGSPKSVFTIVNDKVTIDGDVIANGTILGQHIKANQTINAPQISGGSLSIGGKFSVTSAGKLTATDAVISGTVNATNGVFKGRIEATDGFFGGTVYVNKLEGDVTELLDFQPLAQRETVHSYTSGNTTFISVRTHILQIEPAPRPRFLMFLGEYFGSVRGKYYKIGGNRYNVGLSLEDENRVNLGLYMPPPAVLRLPAGQAKTFYLVAGTIAGTSYYDAMRDPPANLNAHVMIFNK